MRCVSTAFGTETLPFLAVLRCCGGAVLAVATLQLKLSAMFIAIDALDGDQVGGSEKGGASTLTGVDGTISRQDLAKKLRTDNELQDLMEAAGYMSTSLFGQLDEDHDGRVT